MDKTDEKPKANYDVGFKKPPKNKRFQRGKSGNPNGRLRGTLNWKTVIRNAAEERVTINEKRKRNTVSKLEAAAKQLANKAAGGNLQAIKLFAAFVQMIESDDERLSSPRKVIVEVVYEKLPELLPRRMRDDSLLPEETPSSERDEDSEE
jgi:hypothetical protein